LNAEDATVAHVISIREEVVAPVEGTVVAADAGAAAADTAEPEVAKKGKTDADAGAKKPEAKK
jgi:large subunit ribosomal protein L25